MDTLFNQLLQQIEQFLLIGDQAFLKLSTVGITDEKTGELSRGQRYWRLILDTAADRYQKLKVFLEHSGNTNLDHSDLLDTRLAYFREMPRRISEAPPEWAENYLKIDKSLEDICQSVFQIDKKYELGKFKMIKMAANK